jgi:DNA-directed RNA polymerase specialized sigma subunit
MNEKKLLELLKEFQEKPSDAARNSILEEFYPEIFEIAKIQAPKLPENYEITDLFNAGVIALMENIDKVNTENPEEMQLDVQNIIENAIQEELLLSIGPPNQMFINHDEATKIKKEYEKQNKNINKGVNNEKEKGQQEPK